LSLIVPLVGLYGEMKGAKTATNTNMNTRKNPTIAAGLRTRRRAASRHRLVPLIGASSC